MANDPKHAAPEAPPPFRTALETGRWEGTAIHAYKDEGAAPFRDVTRQVLFSDPAMSAEWRYFEVASGGHSTLERHEHVHAVMVHRGRGRCLVGTEIRDIGLGDLVFVPAMTWHQFRATTDEPLGFLCLVNAVRDKPQLPTPHDIATLQRVPAVASFVRT
jgi:mannose-6-phosphate isomerase-like protein (cupin superfamily)